MVVLSAEVTTRIGKVLMARQFVEMSRIRIEGLLAAFPKLISTDSQHTFVETESIRYVYYPVDQLYVLLITNKQSNIMEDLDTLRLLAKVVPETCHGHSEEDVVKNVFELTFAVDEVVSIGYKENVTLDQIHTFCEMDSHEEKLQKIILEQKMNEAREEMKRKADNIDRQKSEMKKLQGPKSGYPGAGMESSSSSSMGGRYGGGGDDRGSFSSSSSSSNSNTKVQKEEPRKARVPKGKGMALGKAKNTKDDFFSKLAKEENLTGPRNIVANTASSTFGTSAEAAPISHDKVYVSVEEKLNLVMEKEGGVKKMKISGELKLAVFDPDQAKIAIKTNGPLGKEQGWKCRLHPKIDNKQWQTDGTLCLKDPSKGFPVGSDNAPKICQWQMTTNEESEVPFTLNFWPNSEDGMSVVSVEYSQENKNLSLKNVMISIPCPSTEPPSVESCQGEHFYDHKEKVFVWKIPEIDEDNDSGSLEFSVPEIDGDEFFPINIQFTSSDTYSGLEVSDIVLLEEDEASCDFNSDVRLVSEKFLVE